MKNPCADPLFHSWLRTEHSYSYCADCGTPLERIGICGRISVHGMMRTEQRFKFCPDCGMSLLALTQSPKEEG
jgi:hypothetical protein